MLTRIMKYARFTCSVISPALSFLGTATLLLWSVGADAGPKRDSLGQLLPGESSQASGPECETWENLVSSPPLFNITECPTDDKVLPGPSFGEHPAYSLSGKIDRNVARDWYQSHPNEPPTNGLQTFTQRKIQIACIGFLPQNADLSAAQNQVFLTGLCANLAHTMVTSWTWGELKQFFTWNLSQPLQSRLAASMKIESDSCLAQMADPAGHAYDGRSLPGFCGHTISSVPGVSGKGR